MNKLYYYLNDHLGSARVVIDSAGTVADKSYYTSFGSGWPILWMGSRESLFMPVT
ncbi:MAG: hypothetical protein AAB305_06115 [Candidatus Zixiibacteriota bacterium]